MQQNEEPISNMETSTKWESLTDNPIQLMFIKCLLWEGIKCEQDVGGHSKYSVK